MAIQFLNDLNVDNGTLYVDTINSRVGVNISSPQTTLQVDGITYLRGAKTHIGKTGNPGTSDLFFIDSVNEDIKIGDVNGYFTGVTGGAFSNWDISNQVIEHAFDVGINCTPKNMLHIFKGNLYLESSGVRDALGNYGSAGQNLKSKGQGSAEWSWEKMTLTSVFYASSFQSGSIIYMPMGGTTSETTSNQYYNNFVAPYNGRVRQIRIKHISGPTPTATSFSSFRVYVDGSLSSSQTPTTTSGGANGMMGVYEYSDTDATFSAGDRVQFAYVASGSTGHIYGATATFIIEYTENS